jgi:hypothetical protein
MFSYDLRWFVELGTDKLYVNFTMPKYIAEIPNWFCIFLCPQDLVACTLDWKKFENNTAHTLD